MKIVDNCWDEIDTFNCQYGAHIFDGSTLKIYVSHWLAVRAEMIELFSRRNEDGFVGHCILVFDEVKNFTFEVRQYFERDGEVMWLDPVVYEHKGSGNGCFDKFSFEGSLRGFQSSVSINVEARKFCLQILEKDEPVSEE